MIRSMLIILLFGLVQTVSAQVASSTSSPLSSPLSASATAIDIEARARDEEFAKWKMRYATNRTVIVREIREVRQALEPFSKTHSQRGRELTDLLNGSINNWNKDKTDFGDPEQLALCRELLTNIRKAIREEK